MTWYTSNPNSMDFLHFHAMEPYNQFHSRSRRLNILSSFIVIGVVGYNVYASYCIRMEFERERLRIDKEFPLPKGEDLSDVQIAKIVNDTMKKADEDFRTALLEMQAEYSREHETKVEQSAAEILREIRNNPAYH
eukprot:1113208_1